MFQPEFEAMNRSDLETLQRERLKATLDRIFSRNPFYAKRFGSLGTGAITTLHDIRKFPFMTKDDLRDGYPLKYACADHADLMRIHMSSGTTGTPIINPYTRSDIEQWGKIMARCYAAAGVTSRDVVQITPSLWAARKS